MKLHKFVFNPFYENTYLLWDEESKETAIIDPGCSNSNEEKNLADFITENKLIPKYLFNTHCHVDHVLGNSYIKNRFDVEFLAPEDDIFLLDLVSNQASSFGIQTKKSPLPDNYIKENLELKLGNQKLIPINTPGHTPGEFCLYVPNDKFCLTGDVLFKDGIGRTDLWGGSYEKLINSIKVKLLSLPEDTIIYPGHGPESTIGYEKRNNSFLS